jgi:hypothetical protein
MIGAEFSSAEVVDVVVDVDDIVCQRKKKVFNLTIKCQLLILDC